MFLFRIMNTLGEMILLRTAGEIYGQSTNQSLWINARKNTLTGSWISYENKTQTIIREYLRLLWQDKPAQTAGDCLSITNRLGPFKLTGYNCTELAPFVCSYKDPLKVTAA
jgi:Lectin C-type domain